MRIFRQLPLVDGDVAAYHEINANQQAVAGEINGGIDRENVVQHALTRAKLEGGQTDYTFQSGSSGAGALTPNDEWTVFSAPGPFVGPGLVIIHGAVVVEDSVAAVVNFAVGLRVNGILIADSGYENYVFPGQGFARMTKAVQGAVWVAEADIRCELVLRVPSAGGGVYSNMSVVTIESAAVCRRR